ncbi:uncharacterized protein SCHCODRAFT_02626379 [Schizophyllum commune H4-8]|uniref:uncharacterized protein n=1 Tax=Schizophyllum commune (strain H4-8 / FGSC 9210) TaxID=578458 RepID=UPI00215F31A5|nr:uncharacterized protein SCHCODRAFT_02626379 [Schizophyllum commune H4-8]KAI5892524.1 hypothetical protein SCHCODRAFT_02626379 [Schizophyllum commune H4-8]
MKALRGKVICLLGGWMWGKRALICDVDADCRLRNIVGKCELDAPVTSGLVRPGRVQEASRRRERLTNKAGENIEYTREEDGSFVGVERSRVVRGASMSSGLDMAVARKEKYASKISI